MKFLPFENITYKSKSKPDVILHKINEVIEPIQTFRKKSIFGNDNHKPYEGSINGNSFDILRIIGYTNSFLPRIKGIVKQDYHGTIIHVKMRLHPVVLVFMCFWCGGVAIALIAVLSISIRKGEFIPVFTPFAMLIFGYGMTLGGFKFESGKAKKYLTELFEAEIMED